MLLIHCVQKLLNTSKLKASLQIGSPSEGQALYSWYAMLVSTGEAGKLMVMYVHEPSLLVVVCRGRTLQTTFPVFRERLQAMLTRYGFPPAFIAKEMELAVAYTVSKTNSRSMLGFMNEMKYAVAHYVRMPHYLTGNLEEKIEDACAAELHASSFAGGSYKTPLDYWRQQLNGTL